MRVILICLIMLVMAGCDGNTPLMQASTDGNDKQIQKMLSDGANVDEENNYGWTALSHAARSGNLDTVKLLIEKGATIDAIDDTNWTPMLRAAQKGHTKVVKFLIEKGADVNVLTKEGWTALMWASLRGKLKTIQYLVTVPDLKINHQAKDGRSAILIAITENNNDILIVLQDAGAIP